MLNSHKVLLRVLAKVLICPIEYFAKDIGDDLGESNRFNTKISKTFSSRVTHSIQRFNHQLLWIHVLIHIEFLRGKVKVTMTEVNPGKL